MKRNLLIALSCFFILTNCSLNDDNNVEETVYLTTWHLREVSGGVAGINDTFDLETIIWTFDEVDDVLTVVNDNTDDAKEDGLDAGTYNFAIDDTTGSDNFLIIDGDEIGAYTISQTELVIDENYTSDGEGTDGFVYTFQRVLVIQE